MDVAKIGERTIIKPSKLIVVVLTAPLGPNIPKQQPCGTPIVNVFTAIFAGFPM